MRLQTNVAQLLHICSEANISMRKYQKLSMAVPFLPPKWKLETERDRQNEDLRKRLGVPEKKKRRLHKKNEEEKRMGRDQDGDLAFGEEEVLLSMHLN